jgi:hypothetical protein
MTYIFLDESGDLGFNLNKSGTSENFIITFFVIKNKKPFDSIVKKTLAKMNKVERKSIQGVLHSYKLLPRRRKKLLKSILEYDFKLMVIRLNKSKVYTHLHNEKQVVYNYITNILLNRILDKKLIDTDQKVHLIASRRETNKFLNSNFKNYLKNKAKKNHSIDIDINIALSNQEKCLQIVDLISWSYFRHIEHKDSSYYNIIKEMMEEEVILFQ